MTNEQFQFWIDGYLRLSDEEFLDADQVVIIKNHANLVQTIVGEKNTSAPQLAMALENKLEHYELIPKSELEKLATAILNLGNPP